MMKDLHLLSKISEEALVSISSEIDINILESLFQKGPLAFSEMKSLLNKNQNTLYRSLNRLQKGGLVDNFYQRKEDEKKYSYYEISLLGEYIISKMVDFEKPSMYLENITIQTNPPLWSKTLTMTNENPEQIAQMKGNQVKIKIIGSNEAVSGVK